jgi:hypothetical protein
MAKHLVMDRSGHSTIEFDEVDARQLDDANRRFMDLVGEQKFIAATRHAGERDYQKIKSPDQQLDETLFLPHNVGG